MDEIDAFHLHPMSHPRIPKRSSCCRWFLLIRVVSLQHRGDLAAGRSPGENFWELAVARGKILAISEARCRNLHCLVICRPRSPKRRLRRPHLLKNRRRRTQQQLQFLRFYLHLLLRSALLLRIMQVKVCIPTPLLCSQVFFFEQ
jgi:hypothetical protein